MGEFFIVLIVGEISVQSNSLKYHSNSLQLKIFSLAVASLLRHYLAVLGINSRIVFGLFS